MKRFAILPICIVALTVIGYSQNPDIQWQNTIGGQDFDVISKVIATDDGGYLLGGYSLSNISGDKTEDSNGQWDIWLIKTNSEGDITWQNTIGGSLDDYLSDVEQTPDGGYILAAGSNSNISGDKTENSRGGLDFWILKLDSSGAITWQKTYGGNAPDFDTFIDLTDDGGYLVSGYSDSGASGDKTEPSNGQRDYWVMKLDINGNIVWQNGIGGNLVDRVQATFQTSDGGYLIAGYSTSNASGDKSENSLGGSDYWIVKVNASGTILWENTIGGNNDDVLRDAIETSDGGFILGGYSKSNSSGDKSEVSRGDFDYWIVKVSSSGILEWDKTIGGSAIDYFRDIIETVDTNFLIAGYSNSNTSGDKSQDSNGGYDNWFVTIDNSGAILNQNTNGGNADESGPYVLELFDGSLVVGSSSASDVSGDKDASSEGLEDFWLFKASSGLLASTEVSAFETTVYPNPSNGQFYIHFSELQTIVNISMYDLNGRKVLSKQFKNKQLIPMTTIFADGLYLLQVETNKASFTKKVIVKN